MKQFAIIIVYFLFTSVSVFSQTNASISGKLIDKSSQKPVIAGSVELLLSKDSSYVAGTISNDKGNFSFNNLKVEKYILKVTYIGYLPVFKNVVCNEKEPVINSIKLNKEELFKFEGIY